jgi:hypothetical protein
MSKTSFGRSDSPLENWWQEGGDVPFVRGISRPRGGGRLRHRRILSPADSPPLETESIAQADLAVESHALRERWGEWTCRAPNRRKEPELWPCLK